MGTLLICFTYSIVQKLYLLFLVLLVFLLTICKDVPLLLIHFDCMSMSSLFYPSLPNFLWTNISPFNPRSLNFRPFSFLFTYQNAPNQHSTPKIVIFLKY